MSAIFIIALVSLLVLANFWIGSSLPLYLLTMSLSMLLALRFPRSGLYAIVFLTFVFERFFTLMTVFWGRNEYKLYPLDLLLAAVFFAIIIQLIGRKVKWKLQRTDYFFLGFLTLSFLYFLFSAFVFRNDFALSFSSFKYYVFYPLLTLATFLLLDSKEHLMRFAKFVLAGAIAIFFFIFYGFLSGEGLWSEFTPLSTAGVRTLAFTHAFYLSMAVLGALVWAGQQKSKEQKMMLVFILIWTLGIVGSMMRHLWIALAAAAFFIFLVAIKQEKVRLIKIAGVYISVAALGAFLALYVALLFPHSAYSDNITGMAGKISGRVTSITNTDDESIAWRGVVWKATMKQYLANPVMGMGVGKKVAIEMGKYRDYVEVRNIHNSFLVLLVQLGIFGIGLLAAAIFCLVKKVWRTLHSGDQQTSMFAQISLGILVLHAVAFLFQPYLETNLLGIFFWINLGLLRKLATSNQ